MTEVFNAFTNIVGVTMHFFSTRVTESILKHWSHYCIHEWPPWWLGCISLQTWRMDKSAQSLLNTFPASGCPNPTNKVKDLLFSSTLVHWLILNSVDSIWMMVCFRCILFFHLVKGNVVFSCYSLPVPASQLSCSSQNSQTMCQSVRTRPAMRMQWSRHVAC